MSTTSLSIDQLKRAVAIAEQIQQLETELGSLLSGAVPSKAPKPAVVKAEKKKRTMSPEARAKIVAAQKARWAKIKGEKAPAKEVKAAEKPAAKAKAKRKVSPEARAKMAAAAKKRWAEKKAA